MEVKKFKEVSNISEQVVIDLQNIILENQTPLICIAGGDTTIPIMKAIVKASQDGKLDTSRMKFISLDEWGSLGRDVKGSCAQTLYDNLFEPLEISEKNIFFFDGTKDLSIEAEKANEFIKTNNGLDYILLGVGMNGHIGFNEPGAEQSDGTIVVDLDNVTKKVMKKYFTEDYPLEQGITLSLNQILQSKKIAVMMTGEHKKEVFKKTMEISEDTMFPVSMLKKETDKLHIYADEKAFID